MNCCFTLKKRKKTKVKSQFFQNGKKRYVYPKYTTQSIHYQFGRNMYETNKLAKNND